MQTVARPLRLLAGRQDHVYIVQPFGIVHEPPASDLITGTQATDAIAAQIQSADADARCQREW